MSHGLEPTVLNTFKNNFSVIARATVTDFKASAIDLGDTVGQKRKVRISRAELNVGSVCLRDHALL